MGSAFLVQQKVQIRSQVHSTHRETKRHPTGTTPGERRTRQWKLRMDFGEIIIIEGWSRCARAMPQAKRVCSRPHAPTTMIDERLAMAREEGRRFACSVRSATRCECEGRIFEMPKLTKTNKSRRHSQINLDEKNLNCQLHCSNKKLFVGIRLKRWQAPLALRQAARGSRAPCEGGSCLVRHGR